jgi:uncharacterized protein YndB with AHSA1/START domain
MKSKAVAKAEMLIRKPAAEVFAAFVDPAITSKFWFTKGSGKLEPGKTVKWDWEMYNVSADVNVTTIEPNKRIVVDWSTHGEPTTIEWTFTPLPDNTTFVSISNSGFSGDDDEILQQVVASTEGFTIVLAALKALLEHGVTLKLVADRFPQGLQKQSV